MNQTFNPIIEECQFQNKFYSRIPVPAAGTEVILYGSANRKKLMITQVPGIKTIDILRGKYDKKIVVDMRPRTISFEGNYQSKNIGVDFIVSVKATVEVQDADIAWESGIRDVAMCLQQEMDADIADVACKYELSEKGNFQQHLKQELGKFYLIGTGILIREVSYSVKLDEKYSKLYQQEYYETQRSKVAEVIQKKYKNGVVAAFAEVASGQISPEEAQRRAQKSISSDFDERMRQLREATIFIRELRESDFVNQQQISVSMEQILGSLMISDGKCIGKADTAKETDDRIQEGQENIYQPFDD